MTIIGNYDLVAKFERALSEAGRAPLPLPLATLQMLQRMRETLTHRVNVSVDDRKLLAAVQALALVHDDLDLRDTRARNASPEAREHDEAVDPGMSWDDALES